MWHWKSILIILSSIKLVIQYFTCSEELNRLTKQSSFLFLNNFSVAGYPGPNKEILKQIHQLFNEEFFRREDEYIISNPLKLEWYFSEEFIIMAAVKYQYHIVWDTKDGMTDTMIHWQMPISVTPELRKESVQVSTTTCVFLQP